MNTPLNTPLNTPSENTPNLNANSSPIADTAVARTAVPSEPTGTLGTDRLYSLLPAIYRIRDGAIGEPLRALLATIEQEVKAVESDIDALYDDWFIETCAEWVVPYIGDLLGVHQLYAEKANGYGQQERRAYVANTLAYRRRKGTTPILEQLARDITGWHTKVVEFGKLVKTTQHLDHIRSTSTTVNLRANNLLQEVGTPFEQQAAYSAEIRPAAQGGRYGLSQVGLFVWRLQSYPMVRSQARAIASPTGTGHHYSFNPLGKLAPLFNQPQSETDIVARAQEINLPVQLRRPVLAAELTQRKAALLADKPLDAIRYFDSDPVLQIFVDGQPTPLAPEDILIRNLTTTEENATAARSTDLDSTYLRSTNLEAETLFPHKVEVDPESGRMAFVGSDRPQQVEVSYHYGFSDDIGGGPYGRNQSSFRGLASKNNLTNNPQPPAIGALAIDPLTIDPLRWDIRQAETAETNPLKAAVETWNQTTTVWQGFQDSTHIPLVNLTIPPIIVATTEPPESLFSPGIVGNGLSVRQGICAGEILVSAGVAIDRQGRRLVIPRHRTLTISSLGINQLPQSKGVLILTHGDTGVAKLRVVAESTLAPLAHGLVIPLAILQVDEQNQRLAVPPDMTVRTVFVSGIVQGLKVRKRPGTLEAWVSAGTGVDGKGQPIVLVENQPIELVHEQGTVRAVILVRQRQEWQLQLVSPEAKAAMAMPYIHLATLDIPQVEIDQTTVEKHRLFPEVEQSGLDVTTSSDRAEIQVSVGSITQAGEAFFTLKETVKIDLSAYAGRSLTIFVSPRAEQGLPLPTPQIDQRAGQQIGQQAGRQTATTSSSAAGSSTAGSSAAGSAAGGIGVVPVAPGGEQVQVGEIVIGDNATYCGDLPVLITPFRQLKIVAGEGYRPHILGDIQVWAIAPDHPGKLSLNGLLIEGAVQVLPGNLQQLTISHCTLATPKGSITVIEPEPECRQSDADEALSLTTVLLYGLTILWQLIGQDLGLCGSRSSSLTFVKTMQLMTARLLQWVAMLERVCQGNQEDWAWESRQDHPQLEISLDHTLSGPISLARTVPRLSLRACVIDPGNYAETSGKAITAPGTHTAIDTCTILGRTRVRALSASGSLFTQKVTVQQRQTGCVRFCYVPITSRTPRRYQCQPDRALQKNLTSTPGDVSVLFVQGDHILCALSGTGIFQRLLRPTAPATEVTASEVTASEVTASEVTASEVTTGSTTWRERTGDLTNRYISAISVHTSPAESTHSSANPSANPSANSASALIIGTTNGQLFYTPLAIPTNREKNTEDWRTLPFPNTNTPISALLPDQQPGQGLVTVEGDRVYGQRTAFQHELNAATGSQPGDFISLNGSALREVIAIGRKGIGRLTLQGNQVTSTQIQTPALTLGNTLTIGQQTRKIVALHETDSNRFTLNKGFAIENLTENSTEDFEINRNTELTLSAALDISVEQPSAYTLHQFWVTTAGSGPWRIPAARVTHAEWESVDTGLSSLTVTTIVRTRAGQLWLGTANAGVFRLSREISSDSDPSGKPSGTPSGKPSNLLLETWLPENTELLSHHINILIEDTEQQLVAGTPEGIFIRPPGSQQWQTASGTQYNITTLVAYTDTNTEIETHVLIAGTTDGKLLRSADSGHNWTHLSGLDLRSTPITTLTLGPPRPHTQSTKPSQESSHSLYLGTATGDILCSSNNGDTWQSLHQTLPHMADKLRILQQLQPAFTTTDSGDPGYCQLTQTCAPALLTGAEDGAEMGVFNRLKQPQRAANLKASLNDYLRFGLTAGIFYIT